MVADKLAVLFVFAVSVSVPPAVSEARDVACAGANQGLAGWLMCSTWDAGRLPSLRSESAVVTGGSIAAHCGFAAVLTPSNTLIVQFGGSAHTTGRTNNTMPVVTAIYCEINNFSEGGTNSQSADFSLNGPTAAAASSTLLATNGPTEWPVKDITVCVSAFGIYGPTPVWTQTLARKCISPNG